MSLHSLNYIIFLRLVCVHIYIIYLGFNYFFIKLNFSLEPMNYYSITGLERPNIQGLDGE